MKYKIIITITVISLISAGLICSKSAFSNLSRTNVTAANTKVMNGNGIVYVDLNATGTGDGSSWEDAFTTIQAAIDHANSLGGAEVWVAQGTYYENLLMKPNVALYGGFNGDEEKREERDFEANPTIMDGNSSGSVMEFSWWENNMIVDGFTITHGSALSGAAGLDIDDVGSTIIKNCKVENNTGAGIWIRGFGKSNQITRCLIRNNTYGINANNSETIIYNNTIVNNTTAGIKSIGYYVPSPTIYNCILWGKAEDLTSTAKATYSCIDAGSPSSPPDPDDTPADVGAYYFHQLKIKDFLGTWSGQGVFSRNSETGAWVKLGSSATKITAGDIDNNNIDDLIGIWPTQGGVWTKYSGTGNWAKLSSTADWIGAGDMNGDGRDDLVGTWSGQGVYYRNSANGNWTKLASPATKTTSGDLDNDGADDLIGIWPTQGGVWVKYSQSGTWQRLSSTADWIACGDMNGDGRADLLGSWTGQGVYFRNSADGIWTKMSSAASQIAAGDIDGDGTDDLVGIWPGQGGVWVKYSGTASWQRLSSTADWIACGKMRASGGSGVTIELAGSFGGIAEGPSLFREYEDLSSNSPGGWDFVYITDKNLEPQMTGKVSLAPGPGEAGFRYIEQKNLVPRENISLRKRIKK